MLRSTNAKILLFVPLLSAVLYSGCGTTSQADSPHGSFASSPVSDATSTPTTTAATHVSSLSLNPVSVVGGSPSTATVQLSQAAPSSGAKVTLKSTVPTVVSVPASVTIASGKTSAAVKITTSKVVSGAVIPLSASYNSSVAGADLIVYPTSTPSGFTVTTNPASLTLQPGSSGSAQITTRVTGGFDQAVQLTVGSDPAGVSASLSPTGIAAPGSGTSELDLSVADNATPGTYSLVIDASGGSLTHTATVQITVSGGSGSGGGGGSGTGGIVGTLHGCWYQSGGHKYQAVKFSMNQAGTVDFDATLYFGATCGQFADRFGFGDPLTLGGSGYIFWFSDFKDQTGTSAIWVVGNQTSQCVDYSTAPDC
ncbi:MAG TPA: hypothetical protein VLW84_02865 [Terriglobales bacterium]|nr:hypothetical protein [Terriglobales bacterium]